jgi:hypothetical protein
MWRVARSVPQQQAGAWSNSCLLVLFSGLLGARLGYVLTNWAYFAAHPDEIPLIIQGGLTWPGAIFGATLVFLYLVISYRSPRGGRATPGWIGDRLYPLLPPLAVTTWLGSWSVGSAFGPVLPAGTWWGIPGLDEGGARGLHWPLQPLAALSLLVYYWILERSIKPLHPPGRLSWLASFGLLLNLLAASLLRADPAPTWYGLRPDTWTAAGYLVFLTGLALFNSLVPRLVRKSAVPSSPSP